MGNRSLDLMVYAAMICALIAGIFIGLLIPCDVWPTTIQIEEDF